MTIKSYNGHKNYAQWNQSLWLNNDGGLYHRAKMYIEMYGKAGAANMMYTQDLAGTFTPDGVKWSKAGIRAAMVGM